MFKSLPSSIRTALIMTGIIIIYFGGSTLLRIEQEVEADSVEIPLQRVMTKSINATSQNQIVEIRGRTKAKRVATVRAETPGQVIAIPLEVGSTVSEGQLLCQIDAGTRSVGLAEAKAAFQKAKLDYDAAVKLAESGFQSNVAVASAKAALDFSQANLTRAQSDFRDTRITAPFDGVLLSRDAEVGDLLTVGAPCGRIAQINPIVITGSVSEQDVLKMTTGSNAKIKISNGFELDAKLTTISPAADQRTRAYAIELEAQNDNNLPDGLTATAYVQTGETGAYLIPRNAILRNDQGTLGVRTVESIEQSRGTVNFTPVSILNDNEDGLWISGLVDNSEIIVRGQNYVRSGQNVIIAKLGKTISQQDTETR